MSNFKVKFKYDIINLYKKIKEENNMKHVHSKWQAERLAIVSPLPTQNTIGRKVYEEVFISPNPQPRIEMAISVLKDIQKEHPQSSGWLSEEGHEGVIENADGFYAFRHHAKYK